MTEPATSPEIVDAASLIDAAANCDSHRDMARALREAFGVHVYGDLPSDLPAVTGAALLAYEYFVEIAEEGGRRRVQLAPRHTIGDDTEPPEIRHLDDEVVKIWRRLAAEVKEPASQARLEHLLFQRGGRGAHGHARAAARAYIEGWSGWARHMDQVDDLKVATRLARAINDKDLAKESLTLMLELATDALNAEKPLAGVVFRALDHLVGENDCPDDVDVLLERCTAAWSDINREDKAYELLLKRCSSPDGRAAIWGRRITAYIEAAQAEDSAILRSVRLQQALELAETSGITSLREEAASLLQGVRDTDREMIRFTASSHRYEEEFEDLVNAIIAGEDWESALVSFGTFGPISGETDQNREGVRLQHGQSPLRSVMPVTLVSPEGLPIFSGTDEESRFDVDLVQSETSLIDHYVRVMTVALHQIPERHGLPTEAELIPLLGGTPGTDGLGPGLADVLLRYWCGDHQGAAFIVTPYIEAIARKMVLAKKAGIYRLQKEQKPGQYPGLGVLLPLVEDFYTVPESHVRFLRALLTHPAGFNLRNRTAHGYVGQIGAPYAAVLIHAALGLVAISARDVTQGIASSSDDGGPP